MLKILLLVLVLPAQSLAQSNKGTFSQALADSLGADNYGMKMYQFVILKTGPVTITNKDTVSQLFKGHLNNINRLVKDGNLIVAGPFAKNHLQYRGLFIFTEKDKEQAKALLATDPAIKAGLLAYELLDWYGSAALPMYLRYSDAVTRDSF